MEFIDEMFECGVEDTNLFKLVDSYIGQLFSHIKTFNNRRGSGYHIRDMIKRFHYKMNKEEHDLERYYNNKNQSEYIPLELVIYCMIKRGFKYKRRTGINGKNYSYIFNIGVKKSMVDYVYS